MENDLKHPEQHPISIRGIAMILLLNGTWSPCTYVEFKLKNVCFRFFLNLCNQHNQLVKNYTECGFLRTIFYNNKLWQYVCNMNILRPGSHKRDSLGRRCMPNENGRINAKNLFADIVLQQ